MAYTLANLQSDIRSYTEVSNTVLTDNILGTIIKNSEKPVTDKPATHQKWYSQVVCSMGS